MTRGQKYIAAVAPHVLGKEQSAIEQYFFQSLVLMVHSHMEDFFKRAVSLAGILRPQELRSHLAENYPQEATWAETEPIFRLARAAADREVAFGKDAVRLKRVFASLFEHPPFVDGSAESDCLDLILIRNIITHDGAWPDGNDLAQVRRKDVIWESGRVGEAGFHKLEISRAFMIDVVAGLGRSVVALDGHLRRHDAYRS